MKHGKARRRGQSSLRLQLYLVMMLTLAVVIAIFLWTAESVMDMLGGFNVLRVCNLANQVLPDGKKVTGGDLLGLNARLNKIRSVP